MKTESTCPLCGLPIVIEVDEDYRAVGDPYGLENLKKMVHCAKCVKFLKFCKRTRDQIIGIAQTISYCERTLKEKRLGDLRQLLEAYQDKLNVFYETDPPVPFDFLIMNAIASCPARITDIVNRIESIVREAPKQKHLV